MKRTLSAFLASCLCAAALCLGLCFCLVTSFSIPVDAMTLVLGCLCAALCASALFLLRRYRLALAGMLALLLAVGGYFREAVLQSLLALYAPVGQSFLLAIPSLPLPTPTAAAGEGEATLALLLLAVFYALVCGWTVQRAKSVLGLLVVTVPVFALCLIILQTPPAPWASLLVVGVLALLLLTQLLRARQPHAGHTLCLQLAGPLAVLLALLAVCFPAGGYERAAWSNALQNTVTQTAEQLTFFRLDAASGQLQLSSPFAPSTLGSYLWDSSVTSVDLSRLGPQRQLGRSVMRVRTNEDKPVYLRGASMAVYEDNHWKALDAATYDVAGQSRNGLLAAEPSQSATDAEALQIQTDMKSGILYTPYYPVLLPASAEVYYDAYIKNPEQLTEYSIRYRPEQVDRPDPAYEAFVHTVYTQVPEATRQALSQLLPQFDTPLALSSSSAVRIERSMQVAAFVMQSARYDLRTPVAPDGEDFAAWFLLESDTGYCVHFATATTLLLRCLDIPARYVTGYCVTPTAGEWSTVTSDEAHAWVEVYLDGVGWYRLETTPASEVQTQPTSEQTSQNRPETTQDKPKMDEIDSQNNQKISEKPVVSMQKLSIFAYIWPVLGVFLLLFFYRSALFLLRKAALRRGNCTRRALVYYHHAAFLTRYTGQKIPQSLHELAQKARFSQHKLTLKELKPFLDFCEAQTAQLLAEKHIWKQFLYRVIFALG